MLEVAQLFAPVRSDDDKMESHTAFTCPMTGQRVDHVFDRHDETPLVDQYEMIACQSCGMVHFISLQTGKLLGHDD